MGKEVVHLDMGRPMRRLRQYPVKGNLNWNGYHGIESNGLIQDILKK